MAMDEISFVVTTLERINTKLDKHDDKIDMIVQAMQQLVKVDTENKENREALKRLFDRVEAVEENQNTDGCSAHKAFVAVRNEQLKSFEKIAQECHKRHEELLRRIVAIEEAPKQIRGFVLKGFLGALGSGLLGWIMWSVSQFGHK